MQKVFLYLYPIEEYTKMFENDNSLAVLNECIQKRYREKGYQVIFALYPDKNLYGIIPQPNDRIIYTDITFKEASGYNEDGTKNFVEENKGYANKLVSFLFKTLAMLNDKNSIAVIIGDVSRKYNIIIANVIEWAKTKK